MNAGSQNSVIISYAIMYVSRTAISSRWASQYGTKRLGFALVRFVCVF
jgi:hypothetical protein